jgi:NAD(P)H-nitrite reductase large subunit
VHTLGFVTPLLLRRIAVTAEKYNAKAIEMTGAGRIAIVGRKEGMIWK